MHSDKGTHNNTSHISLAFFLNLAFTIIEIAGGILTNSIAILSDALHDLGDTISLAVAWYLQKLSNKERDKKYTYGYKRFSLLGAIIISLVLIIGSVFIIKESVSRIISPGEVNAKGMLLLSILGIIVNGIAAMRLSKGKTLNEKAVFIHMMEDVLGWIAVFIVSIIMMFINLPVLDPILSILITLWVLFNVYKNVRKTFRILLQEAPESINTDKLTGMLTDHNEIESIHDLHLWSLDGENNILTLHAVINDLSDNNSLIKIKSFIRQTCRSFGIQHCTVEFESKEEDCELENC